MVPKEILGTIAHGGNGLMTALRMGMFAAVFILLTLGRSPVLGAGISGPAPLGDIRLSGDNVTTLRGTRDINGSILLEENATLILEDCHLNLIQNQSHQHKINLQNPVRGGPQLIIRNSTMTSNFPSAVFARGNSRVEVRDSAISKIALEGIDSSTLHISGSELGDLWAFDSCKLTVVGTEVSRTLVGSGQSYVEASRCAISKVRTWSTARIVIKDDSTVQNLWPVFRTVNGSVSSLYPQRYTLWDSSHAFRNLQYGHAGFAPSVQLHDTEVIGWTTEIGGASNLTLRDSVLTSLRCSKTARIRAINTTFDQHRVYESSEIAVLWYLDIFVFGLNQNPIPGAQITAENPDLETIPRATTDQRGQTRLELLDMTVNSTGELAVGGYVIGTVYGSCENVDSISMAENHQLEVGLEVSIPEFPSFCLCLFSITLLMVRTGKKE